MSEVNTGLEKYLLVDVCKTFWVMVRIDNQEMVNKW